MAKRKAIWTVIEVKLLDCWIAKHEEKFRNDCGRFIITRTGKQ